MTESVEPYNAGGDVLQKLRCSACNQELGLEVEKRGKVFLQVNAALRVYSGQGEHECPADGQVHQFHWDSGEILMRRIMRRRRR